MKTLLVGVGGALGSIARYQIGLVMTRRWPAFPWGTLVVNLLGSLLLAVLMQLALRGRIDDAARIAIGTGVLGGFTTYSTFNYEALALVQQGSYGRAAIYTGATFVGCLAAGVVGWLLARSV